MPLPVLIALTAVLPLVWGWAMYWLVARFWPAGEGASRVADRSDRNPPPLDFQI